MKVPEPGVATSKAVASLNFYIALVTVAWSLVVGGSFYLHHEGDEKASLEMALRVARANFDKDQAYRYWATRHGGVYVTPDERTPPNPYLSHLPDRDLMTTDGRKLTLMNPAYMLRQMIEEFNDLYGVQGDITSLDPLNPVNAPDAWQIKALQALESQDVEEFAEVVAIGGEPYLRLMKPMYVRRGCLKCHGHQGYQVGDVRGGVSVSVPMAPYLRAAAAHIREMSLTHGGIWLLGVAGLGYATRRGRRYILERASSEARLRDLNQELEGRVQALDEQSNRLRESEQRFYRLFEEARDMIHVVDSRGRIIAANRQELDTLGYSREEYIHKPLLEIIPPDHREDSRDCFQKVMEGRRIDRFDTAFLTKDGRTIPVEVSVVPQVEEGEIVAVRAISRDVTERRLIEEKLSRYREELEREVENRTSELTDRMGDVERLNRGMLNLLEDLQASFQRSERMARELKDANVEMESFNYSVSHDLRAPLRAIDGFTSALQEDYGEGLDETGTDYLNRVRAAAKHMGELIDALLQLSRVGRLAINRATLDLSDMAARILAELAESEPERKVEVRIRDGLSVHADPVLTEMLLQNLLQNARKYTVREEVATVELGGEERSGQQVFYIRDNGIGFDMQFGNRIFEPFQRLHRPEEFSGTGVGLASVKRVVARHGGRVWAQSEPNQGATFYFTLEPGAASGEPHGTPG